MNLNIKVRIKKIFVINHPPYFQDTDAWKIILTENGKLKRDIRKLTDALNECYSTIAALENGNNTMQGQIQIIIRNINAGAVSVNWIKEFLSGGKAKTKDKIKDKINFYNHKPESKFEDYKAEYPHVPEKRLRNEWEDTSGDLRHARLCAETGQWP